MKNSPEIANMNKPRDGEQWIMECSIKATRTETLSNAGKKWQVEWNGYATREVLDCMLAAVCDVLEV